MSRNIMTLVHRALDGAGAIEPNATLEFYVAGTSTALTVYSDRALSTTAGSSVTADVAGVFPERWVAADKSIKLVYKSADGATTYTRDYAIVADLNNIVLGDGVADFLAGDLTHEETLTLLGGLDVTEAGQMFIASGAGAMTLTKTPTFKGNVTVDGGSGGSVLIGATEGNIELQGPNPYVDFKISGSEDYRGRMQLSPDGGLWFSSSLTTANTPAFGVLSTGRAVGIRTTQTGSGTVPNGVDFSGSHMQFNQINILDRVISGAENADGTGFYKFVEGATFSHTFGGADVLGGRNGLAYYLRLDAPTSPSNNNRNYCSIAGISDALSGDGGTGVTSGTAKGGFFCYGGTAGGLDAANLLNVTFAEFNVALRGSSSVWAKSLCQLSSRADDRVAGSGVNACFWWYHQDALNPDYNDGFLIDGTDGVWPLASGGYIIRTKGNPTGTDFRIRDDGAIQGVAYELGGDGNGALRLGKASGGAIYPYVDFATGLGSASAVRVQADGGATDYAGTLNIQSAGLYALPGALGTALNDERVGHSSRVTSSNTDQLRMRVYRHTAGSDWSTARWRLERKVDADIHGYFELGYDGSSHFAAMGVPSGKTATLTDTGLRVNSGLTIAPPSSATPAANGELVIEATSNTTVTIKLKGSDGTVRSVALTLS